MFGDQEIELPKTMHEYDILYLIDPESTEGIFQRTSL